MRDPKLRRKLISMGADQFLTKPVQFDELMHEISRFINLTERRRTCDFPEEHPDD
jgi:DNA-binding response OmpR family regulator